MKMVLSTIFILMTPQLRHSIAPYWILKNYTLKIFVSPFTSSPTRRAAATVPTPTLPSEWMAARQEIREIVTIVTSQIILTVEKFFLVTCDTTTINASGGSVINPDGTYRKTPAATMTVLMSMIRNLSQKTEGSGKKSMDLHAADINIPNRIPTGICSRFVSLKSFRRRSI